MPRLGQQSSGKQTENGRLYFGDKTQSYLKQVSREAVEEHHNMSVLYFQLDYARSKKNFYGELLAKKFVHPKGIEVRGAFNIKQNELTVSNGIGGKTMSLTVSVFVEQLKELNIAPEKGDYFAIGRRIYQIYDKTLEDVGPGNFMMGRERMRQDFYCFQEEDESIQKDIWGDNLGLEQEIRPGNTSTE